MGKDKIVVGNLKMNMMYDDTKTYIESLKKEVSSKNVIICPTNIYLPYFLGNSFSLGVQNTSIASEGAYTGELSPKQAYNMGARYSIIGHSERRIHFKEDDSLINKKIIEAIKSKLTVILCIGESQAERIMRKTEQIIKRQIINDLQNLELDMFTNVIIAYEPVWSIGSNITPTNQDIIATAKYIKGAVESLFKYPNIKVIYGGSVNDKNIKELNKIEEIDGFLVGGASLDINKFTKIINVVID